MKVAPTVEPEVWRASMAFRIPQRTQLSVFGFRLNLFSI
jgi:hypothetical protein